LIRTTAAGDAEAAFGVPRRLFSQLLFN